MPFSHSACVASNVINHHLAADIICQSHSPLRGGKTTSGNGQAWSSASSQKAVENKGKLETSWLRSHL